MRSMVTSTVILLALLCMMAASSARAQCDCGDFNGDLSVTPADYTAMYEYLFESGPGPVNDIPLNFDMRPGITIADLGRLGKCLYEYTHSQQCDDTISFPYESAPEQIIYLANYPIPPNTSQHTVSLWLGTPGNIEAVSFPFVYSCATSAVTLDSLTTLIDVGPGVTGEQD